LNGDSPGRRLEVGHVYTVEPGLMVSGTAMSDSRGICG